MSTESEDEDIFDLAARRSPPTSGPVTPAAAAPTVPTKPKLQPIHFGGAAVLATIVWIAWPFVAGSSDSDALVVEQPTQTDTTGITGTAAPPARAELPIGGPTVSSPEAEPTQRELELESLLEGLQVKLTNIEGQISRCTTPVAEESRSPVVKVRRVAYPAPKKRVEPEILKDFVINTVYRNQAWVEKGERTYVVQTGDVIEGIRIISIDAQSRQVVTDHGLIR